MKGNKDIGMLDLNETSRTYFFPNGNTLVINDAVKCLVNKINTHQLMTKQGEIYIVPHGWLAMKYMPIMKEKEPKK